MGGNFTRGGGRILAWVKVEAADRVASSINKFLTPETQAEILQRLEAVPGDLLLIGAGDNADGTAGLLGDVRQQMAARMNLTDATKKEYKIAWVVDFPSFIYDAEEKRYVANHHPFTAPMDEDLPRLESEPATVRAKAYDLVINGYEAGGGSIRIHDPEVQARLFRRLGMTDSQAQERFGFLLDALKAGAPPHGGIALGIDRLAMILAGTTNIRDVLAFPKNQQARDLMTGAPAEVDARQLRELGLGTTPPAAP